MSSHRVTCGIRNKSIPASDRSQPIHRLSYGRIGVYTYFTHQWVKMVKPDKTEQQSAQLNGAWPKAIARQEKPDRARHVEPNHLLHRHV